MEYVIQIIGYLALAVLAIGLVTAAVIAIVDRFYPDDPPKMKEFRWEIDRAIGLWSLLYDIDNMHKSTQDDKEFRDLCLQIVQKRWDIYFPTNFNAMKQQEIVTFLDGNETLTIPINEVDRDKAFITRRYSVSPFYVGRAVCAYFKEDVPLQKTANAIEIKNLESTPIRVNYLITEMPY